MVSEVVSYLNIQPAGIYFDGTVGLGGHAKAILNQLSPEGKLLGIDFDDEMLNQCRQNLDPSAENLFLDRASYDAIEEVLKKYSIESLDGILLDLGLSSVHLDWSKRGFSFQKDHPLDMRFSKDIEYSAADIIRKSTAYELKVMFRDYGEERYAGPIARAIKKASKLDSVNDLKNAVSSVTPQRFLNRTLARIFQALRIAVNQELDRIRIFLNIFIETLNIGGRLVVISYHSLEDRLVKQAFKNLRDQGNLKILTKRPISPTETEIKQNRRSKSAKLRAGERIR
jgi:16S rRNA (cytosine1402-N4)-methyltransferase